MTLGMTLAEVAGMAELSIPYISNLERGRGNPTIESLTAIAAALGVSISSLLGGSEASQEFDPLEIALAGAPASLSNFARSQRFTGVVERIAREHKADPSDIRKRLLIGMVSAPRRSTGDPMEEDWRRLLDVYSLILAKE